MLFRWMFDFPWERITLATQCKNMTEPHTWLLAFLQKHISRIITWLITEVRWAFDLMWQNESVKCLLNHKIPNRWHFKSSGQMASIYSCSEDMAYSIWMRCMGHFYGAPERTVQMGKPVICFHISHILGTRTLLKSSTLWHTLKKLYLLQK